MSIVDIHELRIQFVDEIWMDGVHRFRGHFVAHNSDSATVLFESTPRILSTLGNGQIDAIKCLSEGEGLRQHLLPR